jgi:hypothetical protein
MHRWHFYSLPQIPIPPKVLASLISVETGEVKQKSPLHYIKAFLPPLMQSDQRRNSITNESGVMLQKAVKERCRLL